MNAISFLIKEHNKIKRTFTKIKTKTRRFETKQKLFKALCHDLLQHEMMEHKIWYPHFRRNKKVRAEVRHLLTEENHAEKAIKKFNGIKTQAEWKAKFLKFKKAVEKHAKEEEKKLFPNVEEILDPATLKKIGIKMRQFKNKHKTLVI